MAVDGSKGFGFLQKVQGKHGCGWTAREGANAVKGRQLVDGYVLYLF